MQGGIKSIYIQKKKKKNSDNYISQDNIDGWHIG